MRELAIVVVVRPALRMSALTSTGPGVVGDRKWAVVVTGSGWLDNVRQTLSGNAMA
jgi:hypothetical protein